MGGKDIRRMVSYAVCVDNTDKVRIVQQIILSACTMGIKRIYYMPEYYGIFVTAYQEISFSQQDIIKDLEIIPTHHSIIGNQTDTIYATKVMRDEGVGCILTLGGDGTNRVVAKHCGDIPLIPISTGTNNVFPIDVQGTTAGAAAGFVKPSKRIEIWSEGELLDIALIDAVIIDDMKTESRAMFDTQDFKQVFLTSCTLGSIGISSMGAALQEIEKSDSSAMYIAFNNDSDQYIHFPIVPGVYTTSGYSDWRILALEEMVQVSTVPCVIAVDGEKDIHIKPGTPLEVKVTWNGPKLVDTQAVLKEAANNHLFHNKETEISYESLFEYA